MKHGWLAVSVLAAVISLGSGCGGCGSDFTPTLEEPWEPQSGQLDETCETEACIKLASLSTSHTGTVEIFVNTTDNGPHAQWQTCFWDFAGCWEETDEYTSCIEQAECPAPCKDEYKRLLGEGTSTEEQAAAFEAVFINDEAPCGSPKEEVAP